MPRKPSLFIDIPNKNETTLKSRDVVKRLLSQTDKQLLDEQSIKKIQSSIKEIDKTLLFEEKIIPNKKALKELIEFVESFDYSERSSAEQQIQLEKITENLQKISKNPDGINIEKLLHEVGIAIDDPSLVKKKKTENTTCFNSNPFGIFMESIAILSTHCRYLLNTYFSPQLKIKKENEEKEEVELSSIRP